MFNSQLQPGLFIAELSPEVFFGSRRRKKIVISAETGFGPRRYAHLRSDPTDFRGLPGAWLVCDCFFAAIFWGDEIIDSYQTEHKIQAESYPKSKLNHSWYQTCGLVCFFHQHIIVICSSMVILLPYFITHLAILCALFGMVKT